MTRNDSFFKILFAIEIALIPLTMAAHYLMPNWTVGLFVAGILVAKVWLELFKNKESLSHVLINAIGSVLTIVTLVIFFTVLGYIKVYMGVLVAVFAVLFNVLRLACRKNIMPETIDAVDSCYVLFECLTLVGFTFVAFYDLIANIGLFALVLTAVVSVVYKTYFLCRHFGVGQKIKGLFRRK